MFLAWCHRSWGELNLEIFWHQIRLFLGSCRTDLIHLQVDIWSAWESGDGRPVYFIWTTSLLWVYNRMAGFGSQLIGEICHFGVKMSTEYCVELVMVALNCHVYVWGIAPNNHCITMLPGHFFTDTNKYLICHLLTVSCKVLTACTLHNNKKESFSAVRHYCKALYMRCAIITQPHEAWVMLN